MRRVLVRILAAYLVLVGLVLLLSPIAALLFLPVGSALWLDTSAYLGRGTLDPERSVSAVNCSAESFGTSLRNGPMRWWNCQLILGDVKSPAPALPAHKPVDRYAGLTPAQAHAAYRQGLGPLATPKSSLSHGPGSLERMLPFDRSGELPALQRMPADADGREPPRYAVVWGSRELVSRWLLWGALSLLVMACGAAALYAARVGWTRR